MRARRSLADALALASSRAASWLGGAPSPRVEALRPAQPLVLYEFEACPYCRRVREALSTLGLEAEIRPCPKGGSRFRPEAIARGGKAQFPYLEDPNTGRALYESADIVAYLYAQYAAGAKPPGARVAAVGSLASLLRGARGSRARGAATEPARQLVLYSHEANAEGRLVRELLCELELPHRSRPTELGARPRIEDASSGAVADGWLAIRGLLAGQAERANAPRK